MGTSSETEQFSGAAGRSSSAEQLGGATQLSNSAEQLGGAPRRLGGAARRSSSEKQRPRHSGTAPRSSSAEQPSDAAWKIVASDLQAARHLQYCSNSAEQLGGALRRPCGAAQRSSSARQLREAAPHAQRNSIAQQLSGAAQRGNLEEHVTTNHSKKNKIGAARLIQEYNLKKQDSCFCTKKRREILNFLWRILVEIA